MPRKELPDPVGKCPICTINCYGNEVLNLKEPVKEEKGKEHKTILGKPMVWPCGINREKQGRCPWETAEEQKELTKMKPWELIAGLLGTMHTND